jgi:hypothetical protein
MNCGVYLFADLDASRDLIQQNIRGGGLTDTTDSLIILGFIVVLAIALFCWAYFLRRRPTENQGAHVLVRHKHRHSHSSSPSKSRSGNPETTSSRRVRVRRRRRQREDQLRRNPTLEETGGLPPLRPEDPEPDGTSTARSLS